MARKAGDQLFHQEIGIDGPEANRAGARGRIEEIEFFHDFQRFARVTELASRKKHEKKIRQPRPAHLRKRNRDAGKRPLI